MSGETCPGCGVPLQDQEPGRPGYVPPHVRQERAQVLCQRCFRLLHYRSLEAGSPTEQQVRRALADAVERADGVVWVVDVTDFEGSAHPSLFAGWLPGPGALKRLWVAANKVDLLPRKLPLDEVSRWVAHQLAGFGFSPRKVVPVSAVSGLGVDALHREVAAALPRGRVALLGATNTGKSTLLNRWVRQRPPGARKDVRPAASAAVSGGDAPLEGGLSAGDAPSAAGDSARGTDGMPLLPVASPYPGTTAGVITVPLEGGLSLLDTPGMVAGPGRYSDRVCPRCAAALVASSVLTSRLYALAPGQAFHWSGWAGFEVVQTPRSQPVVVIGYGPEGAQPARTSGQRLGDRLMRGNAPAAAALCGLCRKAIQEAPWREVSIQVPGGCDLAVAGLGWVTVRGGPLDIVLHLPEGVWYRVRPNLVGRKPADVRSTGTGRRAQRGSRPFGEGRAFPARRMPRRNP